jgi:cytochrome c5
MRWLISGLIFSAFMMVGAYSFAGLSGSLDEQKIIERIKPEGEVKVEGGALAETKKATTIADIGQNRYEQTCKLCHETGLAGAPKFGSKEDWAPRIAVGMDKVIQIAIQGLKAMPPKGGCSTCSDDEIKKAVEYMVNHSK